MITGTRRRSCLPGLIGLASLLLTGCASTAASDTPGGAPVRFRDLKIYTTSRPDAADPATVIATMRLVNEGAAPLAIRVALEANEEVGFAEAAHEVTIRPGEEAAWRCELQPPGGLGYELLRGGVWIGDVLERDLFVAVRGPDPAGMGEQIERNALEKITERARVVATYAPQQHDRIVERLRDREKQRGKPTLTLAARGRSPYRIVVGPWAGDGTVAETFDQWAAARERSPAEKDLGHAVRDLRRCLHIQSGAELPITSAADSDDEAPAIRLRLRAQAPDGGVWPHDDAYHLHTRGRDVVVDSGTADGLRQGIYGLLTDHLDCHWFQPRRLGEEITVPADRTVRLPRLDERRAPSFFSSNGMSWGNSPRWDRRNRAVINRGRMTFGHAWIRYVTLGAFPYDEHPDMWARDRDGEIRKFDVGWSSTNFCSTNPRVIEIVAGKINTYFDRNPDAIVASLDPNDYAPMCQCDRCLALDKQYGQTQEDGKEVADRLMHFSQQIHQRLKPEHREKFLGILIYGYQMEMPVSARPHARHAAIICNFPPRYDHTRPWNDPTSAVNRDFHRLVTGWGGQITQFGYYDYYGHYYYFGPFAVIQKMREDLAAFRDLGGTFVFIEAQPNFGVQGLNLYIAAQLAWNVDADVDVLLEQYFAKYYGPAAEAMCGFWLAAERHFALTRPGKRAGMRGVAARPAFWKELEQFLAQAEKAVAGARVPQRFKDRISFNRDGFDYGRLRFELMTRYLPRKGKPKDAAGAITFLRRHGPRLTALQKKYPMADEHRPPMVGNYFHLNVQDLIDKLEAPALGPE